VVLDMTQKMCGSDRSTKAIEAVRALLHMLGTSVNYVNIIMFNETSTYLLPTAQATLVKDKPVLMQLSPNLTEILRSELLDVEPSCTKFPKYKYTDSPMFLSAISEAEDILTYSRKVSNKDDVYSAFCRRAIIVLSANSAPEVKISLSESSASDDNAVNSVSVFAFTYGSDDTVKDHHKQLACNNSGLHAMMPDNDTSHVNEVFKITQYFAAGLLENNYYWSTPMSQDYILNGTVVVSHACRWLITSPPKLLAVVGVAVPVRHVRESLTPEEIIELQADVSTCPEFELMEYGIEEIRGTDRCESATDVFLIAFSIIIGFFVIVITSVGIAFTMLPTKTVKKILPCCVSEEKNVLTL